MQTVCKCRRDRKDSEYLSKMRKKDRIHPSTVARSYMEKHHGIGARESKRHDGGYAKWIKKIQ